MKNVYAVLSATGLALTLLAMPAPAHAIVGRTCEANDEAARCAYLGEDPNHIVATGGVDALKERVRVRVVTVKLQQRKDDRWRTKDTYRGSSTWIDGGFYASASTSCARAAGGKWRSRAVVEWKLGRRGTVHRDTIISGAVSKRRLCG